MKSKRIVSILLALLLTASCVCSTAFAADETASYNEYKKMLTATTAENNYGLEDTVDEGKILQAWNWSYNNVIANLETVAKQGFTTIQVSPPNEIKMATKGVHVAEPPNANGESPNGWWMFYQPAGFQLNESTDNALGTKSEFVKMCEEANKIGVKILVDAVINHMGTDDDHTGTPYNNTSTNPMDHVNPRAAQFEPELLAAKAFHSPWVNCTYIENYPASVYDITQSITQHCTSQLPDLDTSSQLVQDTIYDYLEELILAGASGFRIDAAKHIETSEDIPEFASDFWEDTLIKLRKNYPDKEIYAYGEILNKCGDGRPFSMYTKMMDVTDSSAYWGIKDAVVNGGGGNSIPSYPSYEDAGIYGPNYEKFNTKNVIQWNESHDTYIDGSTSALTVEQRDKIWALSAARKEITGVYFARPDDRAGNGRAEIESYCYDILLGEANITSWANPAVKAVNQFDNYFGDADEALSVSSNKTLIERGGLGATIVNLGGTAGDVNMLAYTLADGKYTDAITGNTFRVTDGVLTGSIGGTGIAVLYYAQDSAPVFPERPSEELGYPVKDGYNTVVFTDSQNWGNVAVYAWSNTDGEAAAWPGIKMMAGLVNDMGQMQYYAYVPENCDNIIFNNNNNGVQSVDTTFSGHGGFYADSQNNEGKWSLGTFEIKLNIYNPLDDYALGDVTMDGLVNISDVTLIQKSLIKLEELDKNQKILADYNGSGTINIKDATAIQYKLIGIE